MKKLSITILVGSLGVGTMIIIKKLREGKTKFRHDGLFDNPNDEVILDRAGTPGQIDGYEDEDILENAKMVSEGSQFGVNYFNEVQEEESDNKR